MAQIDLMQDPYYVQIIYLIESPLHEADKEAAALGVEINDSQVNSVVNKAISFYLGKNPKLPEPVTPRDQVLRKAYTTITAIHETMDVRFEESGEPFPAEALKKHVWRSLKAVRASIKSRKVAGSGSRGYLDFLAEFLPDGG